MLTPINKDTLCSLNELLPFPFNLWHQRFFNLSLTLLPNQQNTLFVLNYHVQYVQVINSRIISTKAEKLAYFELEFTFDKSFEVFSIFRFKVELDSLQLNERFAWIEFDFRSSTALRYETIWVKTKRRAIEFEFHVWLMVKEFR